MDVAKVSKSEERRLAIQAEGNNALPDESDMIFKAIQSLRNARKKISPAGQQRLLKAITDLFGNG